MGAAKVVLAAGLASAAVAVVFTPSAVATSPSRSASAHQGRTLVQTEALAISGSRSHERAAPTGNFAVAPGVPVRLEIVNFTHEYHTISIPGLHVSALIFPARGTAARRTTVTFTASEYGTFAWYCAFCPAGAHGVRHAMGGKIYAIIDPSTLP